MPDRESDAADSPARASADGLVSKEEGNPVPPQPASVQYNDWRQVALPAPEAFTPTRPVSVIIPSYHTPTETLAMTLAALETQTYPRDMFEVVIVDDGSEPPLTRPRSTPLDVTVVRQERQGFGVARARNTGVRAAAHDILLFLDGDRLVEAVWIAAHARWHHVVSDALTVGFCAHVAVDGMDAETMRSRPGSLADLFSTRPVDPPRIAGHMIRTNDLTSRDDGVFRGVTGGNFGIGKGFYHLVGGSDESFTRWGWEDTELSYRAYTYGGLLVPVRDAFAWHQGRWNENKNCRGNLIQHEKAAHVIAHRGFRRTQPGRIYTVPQYVVSIDAGRHPTDQVIRTTATILADREHDLVVILNAPTGGEDEHVARLREAFGPDPRVRVAPAGSPLDEFPTAPFQIALPANAAFAKGLVHRLRVRLGSAVIATSVLPDGSHVSITRAWALHRARRTGKTPAAFGEARTIPPAKLKLAPALPSATARATDADRAVSAEPVGYPTKWERFLDRTRNLRGSADAWAFLKWVAWCCRRTVHRHE